MDGNLDIVALVTDNKTTIAVDDYQNKVIKKIKETFTQEEEQLFAASFQCYLNYDDNTFVIELAKIWKWLGYSRVEECKRCLTKNFKENVDYKIENIVPQDGGKKNKSSII